MRHYHEQVYNYFDVAFACGMRPEEEIALMWRDIDWNLGHATIQRAKSYSYRGNVKPVKGYKTRYLELTTVALAALKRQKAHTFMKTHGFIFENPVTENPWHDERSQRDHYWTPALKRCGIRHRGSYHTRHTFATVAIMVGCNATWVAKQMGNSPRSLQALCQMDRLSRQIKRDQQTECSTEQSEFFPMRPQFLPAGGRGLYKSKSYW